MNIDVPLGAVNDDVGGRATSVADDDEVNTVSGRDDIGSDAIGPEDDGGAVVETVAGIVEDEVEGSMASMAATSRGGDGAAAAAEEYDGGGS
jgi:hypothetical protein